MMIKTSSSSFSDTYNNALIVVILTLFLIDRGIETVKADNSGSNCNEAIVEIKEDFKKSIQKILDDIKNLSSLVHHNSETLTIWSERYLVQGLKEWKVKTESILKNLSQNYDPFAKYIRGEKSNHIGVSITKFNFSKL